MENRIVMTYSLLTHLKETRLKSYSSIVELFFPIVKKSIVEYAKERGNYDVKGKNITEIKEKISDYFGINIPVSVLDFILSQVSKEINNEKIFAYNSDKSFIINAFIFTDIDDEIRKESENIETLKKDFEAFCETQKVTPEFNDLIKFICSQKIELFASKDKDLLNIGYHIPKYVALKFDNTIIFKIISDIYLGSLISAYFEFKISTPVANTELLIDTNFFISLINLNTHEAYVTCKELYDLSLRLGYRFSILYSTVDQIKYLLNTRIYDFANKDIGLVDDADIFGACIRRNLSQTDLERIKDQVEETLREFGVDIIYKTRIAPWIEKAKKSKKYKELLDIRHQTESALNDAIAYIYVTEKRGNRVREFSDAKCWFLNNSYTSDHYIGLGYKLHERYKISANELLSLLWLANPNQQNFEINTLTRGGLATFIVKYKQEKTPSVNTLKDINQKAKKALQQGDLKERDIYSISIRMAEGQFTNGELTELTELPDEEFIEAVKEFSKNDNAIIKKIDEQSLIIAGQNERIDKLFDQNKQFQDKINEQAHENSIQIYINDNLPNRANKYYKASIGYIFFIILLSTLWIINDSTINFYPVIHKTISFILFIVSFFIRLVDHKSILKCLSFTFSKKSRIKQLNVIKDELRKIYAEQSN